MDKKRIAIGAGLAWLCAALCGCWDRVEINDRGFVVGVAIDAPSRQEEESASSNQDPSYEVTYQIVVPAGMKNSSSPGGAGSSKAYFNMTSEAPNLATFTQLVSQRSSRAPFFDHLKVLIVSEKVASSKTGFSDAIDYFLRDPEMRRSMKLLVAKGKAMDVLKVETPNEKLPAIHVDKVTTKPTSIEMLPASKIGEVQDKMLSEDSFVIQQIDASSSVITVADCAIFDGLTNREVGALNDDETAGLNFIRGGTKEGILTFTSRGRHKMLKMDNVSSEIKADVRNPERIGFRISVRVEGAVIESYGKESFNQVQDFTRLESDAAREIVNKSEKTIVALQHVYRKDVMELRDELYRHHYKVWRKIHSNWDQGANYFSRADIKVDAQVAIRRTGNVNKSGRE